MLSRVATILTSILLVGVILLAGACSSGGASSAELYPTVTPLPGDIVSIPQPTSTTAPVPTPDISESADFLEGMRHLEDDEEKGPNFDLAVAAFRRAYQDAPENELVQEKLAEAYLEWGRALINDSEGKPEQLTEAADKFVSGLRFAAEDSDVYNSLQWEQNVVQQFLQGVLDLEELSALRESDVDLEAQQQQAERTRELFAAAYADHPNLPGLRDNYATALLIAAEISEDLGNEQDSRAAALPHWEEAQRLSEQGQEIVLAEGNTKNELNRVARRVDERINPPPLPTPVPQPTAKPGPGPGPGPGPAPGGPQLVQIPDVRGADVGQARAYLQQLGFAVAVSALPAGQDGELCNGWVSYSSPPKGSQMPAGSQVILFYRSTEQPNSPGC